MKRKVDPHVTPPPAAAEPLDESGEIGDDSAERVVERPDGFHWLAPDGRQEFGPFDSREDALADMLATGMDSVSQPGTLLHEAEEEIGITDWIDPETGEPPEGQSPPHLEDQ